MNWKQIIEDIMQKHELLQYAIADISGVNISTINALYTGRNKEPKHSTGEILLKLLNSNSVSEFELLIKNGSIIVGSIVKLGSQSANSISHTVSSIDSDGNVEINHGVTGKKYTVKLSDLEFVK